MSLWTETEFWVSLAFLLAVGLGCRPGMRALKAWAERQADQVRAARREAEDILHKAEQLHKTYEAAYRGRTAERQRLIAEAESEIRLLTRESERETADRLARRKQEMDFRLDLIAQSGQRDMYRQLTTDVIRKTRQLLSAESTARSESDSDRDIAAACRALDCFRSDLTGS